MYIALIIVIYSFYKKKKNLYFFINYIIIELHTALKTPPPKYLLAKSTCNIFSQSSMFFPLSIITSHNSTDDFSQLGILFSFKLTLWNVINSDFKLSIAFIQRYNKKNRNNTNNNMNRLIYIYINKKKLKNFITYDIYIINY